MGHKCLYCGLGIKPCNSHGYCQRTPTCIRLYQKARWASNTNGRKPPPPPPVTKAQSPTVIVRLDKREAEVVAKALASFNSSAAAPLAQRIQTILSNRFRNKPNQRPSHLIEDWVRTQGVKGATGWEIEAALGLSAPNKHLSQLCEAGVIQRRGGRGRRAGVRPSAVYVHYTITEGDQE